MAGILTQEYVKSILFLDEDWELYWLDTGERAEYNRHRYYSVRIDGKHYYSHRIIWLYLYGTVPDRLDHKDGDGYNNCPENLRKTNQSQNTGNADFGPLRGVERHGAKYRARIWIDNERVELGSYHTLDEAIDAYEAAAIKYFGDYAYCARVA